MGFKEFYKKYLEPKSKFELIYSIVVGIGVMLSIGLVIFYFVLN